MKTIRNFLRGLTPQQTKALIIGGIGLAFFLPAGIAKAGALLSHTFKAGSYLAAVVHGADALAIGLAIWLFVLLFIVEREA